MAGDIGCYALGGAEPLNAKDMCICDGRRAKHRTWGAESLR